MGRVVDETRRVVGQMQEGKHRFTMIFFDDSPRVFSGQLVAPDKRHRKLSTSFLRMVGKASGSTDAVPALQAALQVGGAEALVFVTAGQLNDAEYRFLQDMLKQLISGRAKRQLRVYIVPAVRTRRATAILKLAEQQR